jgi:hypothetical protein
MCVNSEIYEMYGGGIRRNVLIRIEHRNRSENRERVWKSTNKSIEKIHPISILFKLFIKLNEHGGDWEKNKRN